MGKNELFEFKVFADAKLDAIEVLKKGLVSSLKLPFSVPDMGTHSKRMRVSKARGRLCPVAGAVVRCPSTDILLASRNLRRRSQLYDNK